MPLSAQHVGEGAHAVAAHLSQGAVGVAVVHEPFVTVYARRKFGQHARAHQGVTGGNANHPVAADAGAPVCKVSHAILGKLHLGRLVHQDNEVVLRAVGLNEIDHAEHSLYLLLADNP